MPKPKSKLEAFLDHLRAFFTLEPAPDHVIPSASEGSAFSERLASRDERLRPLRRGPAPPPAPREPPPDHAIPSASEGSAFSERLASLEQRLETLTAAPATAPGNTAEAGHQGEQGCLEGEARRGAHL